MCGSNSSHQHLPLTLDLNLDLMGANDSQAQWVRSELDAAGVCSVNLMSGPGAGKTSLLERTLVALQPEFQMAVAEGDMTTELDAERLRALGAPVVAITTGRACHLDAEMMAAGLEELKATGDLNRFDLLFVENVGNLVCPAEFPLGEHAKVALVAVTEGEDKPLKYPLLFHYADCIVVTKIDLLPYLKFNLSHLIEHIRQVNSHAPVLALSAETGEGLTQWLDWLRGQVTTRQPGEVRREPNEFQMA